jgi:hypothetical protein
MGDELPDPTAVQPEPPPDGHRWEWFIDEAWRLADIDASCRFMEAGKGCGAPAVARMKRGQRWFSYCGDHLYGRHIHDGKVWALRLVPLPEAVAARSSQPRTDLRQHLTEVVRRALIEDAGMPAAWFPTEGAFVAKAVVDAVLDLVARTHPDPGEALLDGRSCGYQLTENGVLVTIEGQGKWLDLIDGTRVRVIRVADHEGDPDA